MNARPAPKVTLAVLFWLAGAFHLVGALLDFGFMDGPFGPATSGLLLPDQTDGLIQAFAAFVNLFVVGGLWGNQMWARDIVMPLVAINLLVALATRIEDSQSWVSVLPMVFVSIAILLIARSRPQT